MCVCVCVYEHLVQFHLHMYCVEVFVIGLPPTWHGLPLKKQRIILPPSFIDIIIQIYLFWLLLLLLMLLLGVTWCWQNCDWIVGMIWFFFCFGFDYRLEYVLLKLKYFNVWVHYLIFCRFLKLVDQSDFSLLFLELLKFTECSSFFSLYRFEYV